MFSSQVIERVVEDLNKPSSRQTDIFLAQLGHMHQTMGVEKHFLDYMGPIFCQVRRKGQVCALCLLLKKFFLHSSLSDPSSRRRKSGTWR